MIYIQSKDNIKFKKLKKLSLKKYRDSYNLFLAEGIKFKEYLKLAKEIIITESKKDFYLSTYPIFLDKNIIILSDNLFNELSIQTNSQGILFLFEKDNKKLCDLKGDLIILDNIQDPGNLGTIIRTSLAANYKNIILTNDSVDCYNIKVIRATMGAIFNVNIVYEDKKNILDYLLNNSYNIMSTCLQNDSVDYLKMKLSSKNAFIFGNEGQGISSDFLKISNQKLKIKISDDIESLNISIALAVILYKSLELK